MDFGKWIVTVAVNGVKNGSFSREWAAMQLGNHYSNGKITDADLQSYDEQIAAYDAEMAEQIVNDDLAETLDAEKSSGRKKNE